MKIKIPQYIHIFLGQIHLNNTKKNWDNKNDKRNNQINGVSLIPPLRNVYIMAAVPYASNLKTVMYENKDGVTLKRRS